MVQLIASTLGGGRVTNNLVYRQIVDRYTHSDRVTAYLKPVRAITTHPPIMIILHGISEVASIMTKAHSVHKHKQGRIQKIRTSLFHSMSRTVIDAWRF